MQVNPFQNGYIEDIINFLDNNEKRLVYNITFFFLAGLVSVRFPVLRPIVAAAFLLIPLLLIIRLATAFDEQDYEEFSPVIENIYDVRFLLAGLSFLALPLVSWYLEAGFGWTGYGTIGLFMIASSVGVFVWSEGSYVKNFYFDRWHPLERGLLFLSGILALILGPVFVPLFLLAHKIITHQFDYPDIGGFMRTHSRLPLTILRIAGAFAFVRLFLPVQANQVTFLLLCGFSAHYFHPGFAKLVDNGPLYYLRNNNPLYMFLNAHAVGWMEFIDESTVTRVGKVSDRIKSFLNLTVVGIEIGSILLLLSVRLAVIIVLLIVTLQLLILVTTGVNFWKWIFVDLFLIAGFVFIRSQIPSIFGDIGWIIAFVVFVVLARGWMNPVTMSWLDAPYIELFRFKAKLTNGDVVTVHPNLFRPYDPIIAQGTTGAFIFLGKHPRIQFCLGAINETENKDMHHRLTRSLYEMPLDSDESSYFVKELGVKLHDEKQTREMKKIMAYFLNTSNNMAIDVLRFVSSPREFYSNGLSVLDSYDYAANCDSLKLYRIDGIWTDTGFQELNCEEVISVQK